MTIQFNISNYLYKCLKKRIELNVASELDRLVDKGTVIEQEPKTEWIPVSERLPEKNTACLVTIGELNLVQIAMYSDLMKTINHRIFYQGNYGKDDFRDITQHVKAWCPLPEPYKESEG